MTHVDYALKEWDAQVRALARGETAVLLRKGGIMETHDGFEVEHRAFLLYPTFLHQNPQELRPDLHGDLRADPSPGRIVMPALAEVVDVHRVTDLERALALTDMQCLTPGAVERRFRYRDRPWLHALVVRVTVLDEPVKLDETPEMLGCVSWVPLQGRDVEGRAALAEDRLAAVREEVRARVGA
ncbi:DUF1802 family protein [Deinococcus pimensis]|uniref:DUF1802 family protein n=1 Tax=Deinococcus pimensis TaxID=309888 RepID=UPI000483A012|nr:DUF1802 family protein [Deinococcus pimensis]